MSRYVTVPKVSKKGNKNFARKKSNKCLHILVKRDNIRYFLENIDLENIEK